jgi:hypothetical protein
MAMNRVPGQHAQGGVFVLGVDKYLQQAIDLLVRNRQGRLLYFTDNR